MTRTRWTCLALVGLLAAPDAPGRGPDAKPTAEQLLLRGAYADVGPGGTPRDKAAWAFARLQLAPTRDAYDAAWDAHQHGDPLGTFVVLACHDEGRAVRRDAKVHAELTAALRTALADRKEPTPLECYLLSRTSPADAARKWLQRAADGGVAEAVLDLGKRLAQDGQFDKAHALIDQAADLGLAAAWRTKGFTFVEGIGVAKDAAKGVAATREAADRGDALAMVSLAYYHDKGLGLPTDKAAAKEWIEKAAATGHWLGYLERAQSRLQGINGYRLDTDAAKPDIARALATRNRDVPELLALWYANAIGVDRDGRKAVRLGEAAFVQGSRKAAGIVAHVYKHGVGGVEADEARAAYWQAQSNQTSADFASPVAEDLERRVPGLTDRLRKLDPWEVK